MNQEIKRITVRPDVSILYAIKHMDEIRRKLLIVADNGKYLGLLSIGDIQRAVINNTDLASPIPGIMRNDYIIARPGDSLEEIRRMMLYIRSEFMPVVDNEGHLVSVYFWEEVFGDAKPEPRAQFNLPVVIMAGGRGTRLKPLTNILPKPLLPIGEKTMLEEIFDRFGVYGCTTFYISVNYKAAMIKSYIRDCNLHYSLHFIEEPRPLGTAGSLAMLKDKIDSTSFVTNCDILIEQDYSQILDYHREQGNEITVVAALKHFPIAYGTIETGENGQLTDLTEKPELTFKINSGMYIIEPGILNEIRPGAELNFTDLIRRLKLEGRKVGVFPVSQNSWTDIGDWKEYLSAVGKK